MHKRGFQPFFFFSKKGDKMKTNSTKTNQYLIICPIEIILFFENSFLINYIVGKCMKSRIKMDRWIIQYSIDFVNCHASKQY